jgi:spermidine synthase
MAVLWQLRRATDLFEIRSAGRSRRFYRNGVLHSQYHPDRLLTGSVWDLLALPALSWPTGRLQRVLILGAGGGSVVHLLQRLVQPHALTAVDLVPETLAVARRFFALPDAGLRWEAADGTAWVQNYRGPGFDYIIDDLFCERDGDPVRAVAADKGWLKQLAGLLRPTGTLVFNFADMAEMRDSACWRLLQAGAESGWFAARYLSHPSCQNRVLVLDKAQRDWHVLRSRLHTQLGIADCRQLRQKNFRIYKVYSQTNQVCGKARGR